MTVLEQDYQQQINLSFHESLRRHHHEVLGHAGVTSLSQLRAPVHSPVWTRAGRTLWRDHCRCARRDLVRTSSKTD